MSPGAQVGAPRGTVRRECTLAVLREVATLLTGWNELFTEVSPCEPVNLKAGV